MIQPPPPPSGTQEEQIHISRDGKVLGVWPASAIRTKFISGEFKPSDYGWCEGAEGWTRLIPEPPSPAQPYPYLGDNRPFYFMREGLLFGPRTAAEIDALVAVGWLSPDDMMTFFGAEQWWSIQEFMLLGADDEDQHEEQQVEMSQSRPAPEIAEEPAFDWITHGVHAYIGDPVAGAKLGFHAAKKAFAWISETANNGDSRAGAGTRSLSDSTKERCKTCGTPILPATNSLNDGQCFRCRPRKKSKG